VRPSQQHPVTMYRCGARGYLRLPVLRPVSHIPALRLCLVSQSQSRPTVIFLVFTPGTKWCCLVIQSTDTCEQIARSCYLTVKWQRIETAP